MSARAALAVALLAAPAAAQDGAAIVSRFRDRCAAVAADPQAAVNATLDLGSAASGAVTPDRAIAQLTEELPLADDNRFGTFLFHRAAFPGGAVESCVAVVALAGSDGTLPDLLPILDAQAAAILSAPPARIGGPVLSGGLAEPQPGQLVTWSTGPGFPPAAVLSLQQTPQAVTLSLGRAIPAAP